VGWAEWNGKYRDCVRRFWKGDGGTVSEFATRLCGSADLYSHSGRRPYASVNFITCHDGFSLNDLVSYNEKHNEANGEDNKDGANDNNSWNCGVEGPTDDPGVLELRQRQTRNLLATLLVSQGVPMLLAGDELGHSQRGNNNAYCQDNEISWLSWDLNDGQKELLEFTQRVIRLKREQPVLHRRTFLQGRPIRGSEIKDITWLVPSGQEMTDEDWNAGFIKAFTVRLAGDAITELNARGERMFGDTFVLFFNAHHEAMTFTIPQEPNQNEWKFVLDTSQPKPSEQQFKSGAPITVQARTMVLLSQKLNPPAVPTPGTVPPADNVAAPPG
jgi:glycogen operon protein